MYCTMYIKVLYNIKDNKKNLWEGEGAILEPKTLSLFLKKSEKKKKKKIDRDGIGTHDLRVRKPALLSTRLNTMIAITKYE